MQTYAASSLHFLNRTVLSSAMIALLASSAFAREAQTEGRRQHFAGARTAVAYRHGYRYERAVHLSARVDYGPGRFYHHAAWGYYAPGSVYYARQVYYAPRPVYYPGLTYSVPVPVYYPGQAYYVPAPVYHQRRAESVPEQDQSAPPVHRMTERVRAVSSVVETTVTAAPPPLPVYAQSPIPGPGYVWTPGYWAYAADYYWVPGTWVLPPYEGALWTPGYWGWSGSAYVFHSGYWGLSVGYYGGIRYGFGYAGTGYEGGYWNLGVFHYNRACNNFGEVRIAHAYDAPFIDHVRTFIGNIVPNRASFNGPGGENLRPTAQQVAFAQENHTGPLREQNRQQALARGNGLQHALANHGMPPIAATRRAGEFEHVAATSASNRPVARHDQSAHELNNQRVASRRGPEPSEQRAGGNHYSEGQPRTPKMYAERSPRMPRSYSQDMRGNPGMHRDDPRHGRPAHAEPGKPEHREHRDYRG